MANNLLDCPDFHNLHYFCNLEPLALGHSFSSLNFLCFSLFAKQMIDNLYNFNQKKFLNYIWVLSVILQSFLGCLDAKESAHHEGDLGSVPGLGRSHGGEHGIPLQYSWASLVAQLIKNLRAMRETWVQSLGWEDPLEKGKATHSSVLA